MNIERGVLPLVEKDSKKSTISMDDLRKKAQEEGGVILYHGGLSDNITIEEIDLNRFGSQQNKTGRTYGGFYLTDESSKKWTEKYASERNGNIHGFLITNSSRIVEIQDKDIDRLSQEQRTELAKNYDLIKGKDLLGRVQYVLLNKEVVSALGIEKQEKKYESGNVTFFAEGAQNSYQHELTKSIIESISPYMDNKVHVQYKEIKKENAGFNSILNSEFRDENYHDSITVNSNYQHQDELPFFLSHELGHSFEEKLEQIIKNKGTEALPIGIDDEYADFYADLIAVYILKPKLLKKLEDIPTGKNTLLAIQEMFKGEDFTELRKKIDVLSKKETGSIPNSEEETKEQEERIAKLFERVFVKINEYINQQK